MQDHTFTLIVSVVGIGGALSGIVIGHFLTRSSQHEQWLRDNRKQEFKEVVAAISHFIIEQMSYAASQGSEMPQSKQAYLDSFKAASGVLCDRIYIHADLRERNIPDRFLDILDHFHAVGADFDGPANEATALLEEIIAIARSS